MAKPELIGARIGVSELSMSCVRVLRSLPISYRVLGKDVPLHGPRVEALAQGALVRGLAGGQIAAVVSMMNTRADYWLAIVSVRDGAAASEPAYVNDPVARALAAEPKFGLVSVQLDIATILAAV